MLKTVGILKRTSIKQRTPQSGYPLFSHLYAPVKIQRSQLVPELEEQVLLGDVAEDFQRAVRHTEREQRAVVAGADMAHGVYNSRRYGFSLAVRGTAAADSIANKQVDGMTVS